jgi:alkanesulfonate monooxygenase SsuD/methylene tetrahydromethanopterin reductase-like flavin-dependent oxidoreductase (luciferase family)
VRLGVNIIAAETDAEARFLFSSLQQSFVNLRRGRPGKLPPPVADIDRTFDRYARAMLDDSLACAIVGAPDSVWSGLTDFIQRTGADELMVTANIFDHDKRRRSFEIVAEARDAMPTAA